MNTNNNKNWNNDGLNETNEEGFTKKLGDKIERTGEKIADKGAPKLGEHVKKFGDKVEHSQDKKEYR